MAQPVTLAQLRERARNRADFQTSDPSQNFVTDPELNEYINSSLAELYDLIIEANGDEYFSTAFPFATTSGTDTYALPEDFYRLSGVDAAVGGFTYTLYPYPFAERNRYANLTAPGWYRGARLYYRLRQTNIVFVPIPDGDYVVTLHYIPNPPILVDDGDSFDFNAGWDEYVIVDVSIKMRIKEETDTAELQYAKTALLQRIRNAAPRRDDGMAQTVSDVARDWEGWLY